MGEVIKFKTKPVSYRSLVDDVYSKVYDNKPYIRREDAAELAIQLLNKTTRNHTEMDRNIHILLELLDRIK